MQFSSHLSNNADTRDAVHEVVHAATERLGSSADLACLFLSHHHVRNMEDLVADVHERLGARCLMGCTGETIVGVGRECEEEPAVSLWLAQLPDVQLWPMHLELRQTPEGGSITGWPDDLPAVWPEQSALIVLAEPFSFPADYLVQRLNEDQPGIPVVGGMASGAPTAGQNRLLLNDKLIQSGAVAVLMSGSMRLKTVVSQGCRPIGSPLVITKAERNCIFELGGKPAVQQLRDVYQQLPTREQAIVQRGLHVGRVISEYQDRFESGDFLVRNVMGIDSDQGLIAIGDYVRAGQTVQFHIRDHETADAELRQLLSKVGGGQAKPLASLLFTCNGRGTRLFKEPHHDAAAIQQSLGPIPTAGFFAQGEIGPIGRQNFVHGFTASIALFG